MYAMKIARRYAVESTPILLFTAACVSMVYSARESTLEVEQAGATATNHYLQRNWWCPVSGGVVTDGDQEYACDFYHFCASRAVSNSNDVPHDCANVEKEMDTPPLEPDWDNGDTDDAIRRARDGVFSMATVWEAVLDDSLSMIIIRAIVFLGLVLYMALAAALCRFKRPTLIHEDVESFDLALCFHLNLAFKHRAFLYVKCGCGLFVLSVAAFGVSNAAYPTIILRTILLDLIIALKSLFDLFQPADKCSFTYSDYQQRFLNDFKNANDTARETLIQSSGVRVLEAIAQQTSVEIPQAAEA
jgi:hypothetical protein